MNILYRNQKKMEVGNNTINIHMNNTKKFYDELSSDYHLIFADWNTTIKKQADVLDKLIWEYSKIPWKTLLDCSCGIGTQCIWLAEKWYHVTATDLSPNAIERAKLESVQRGLEINFWVADFMKLNTQVKWEFDIILSCDNSLPHILKNTDLEIVAKNISLKLKQGWLFIASIRDYDAILKEKQTSTQPNVKKEWTISFQTWDWKENNIYTVNHFTIRKNTDIEYSTSVRNTQYRAYRRKEMESIFEKNWFKDIIWLMPEVSWYYQPIMIAYK